MLKYKHNNITYVTLVTESLINPAEFYSNFNILNIMTS